MKQLRTATGAEARLALAESTAAGLAAHISDAAENVLARMHAAYRGALAGISIGDASESLPNIRTNFEEERFYFLVAMGVFFLTFTASLIYITYPDSEEEEGSGSARTSPQPADAMPAMKKQISASTPAASARGSGTPRTSLAARGSGASLADADATRGSGSLPAAPADSATPAAKGWKKLAAATLTKRPSAKDAEGGDGDPTSPGDRFYDTLRRLQSGVKSEEGDTVFEVSSERLIEDKGISGLCVVDPSATCGVTGVQVWTVVVTSALQCWILQFFVLYWLYVQIQPRQLKVGAIAVLPWSIVFAAAYTHFISCVSDFAFDFYLLFWIQSRKEPYRWVFVTVFIMDAFIIPTMTLIIGTMYLINSKDVHETILNCCAVAFISHIDDWILSVSGKMEEIVDRTDYHKTIKVHINRKNIQRLNWWVCLIPVIPTTFTMFMMWLGQKARL